MDATTLLGATRMAVRANCLKPMPKTSLVSVVEDDRNFRDSMRRLMMSLGYNVEAFSSAANFLASPRLIETTYLVASNGLKFARQSTGYGRERPPFGGPSKLGRASIPVAQKISGLQSIEAAPPSRTVTLALGKDAREMALVNKTAELRNIGEFPPRIL